MTDFGEMAPFVEPVMQLSVIGPAHPNHPDHLRLYTEDGIRRDSEGKAHLYKLAWQSEGPEPKLVIVEKTAQELESGQ